MDRWRRRSGRIFECGRPSARSSVICVQLVRPKAIWCPPITLLAPVCKNLELYLASSQGRHLCLCRGIVTGAEASGQDRPRDSNSQRGSELDDPSYLLKSGGRVAGLFGFQSPIAGGPWEGQANKFRILRVTKATPRSCVSELFRSVCWCQWRPLFPRCKTRRLVLLTGDAPHLRNLNSVNLRRIGHLRE
jgi:hypothetical protein